MSDVRSGWVMQFYTEAKSGDHCHGFSMGWVYGQSRCI